MQVFSRKSSAPRVELPGTIPIWRGRTGPDGAPNAKKDDGGSRHANPANTKLMSRSTSLDRISHAVLSQIFPFQTPKVHQEFRVDLKFIELRNDPVVLLRGQGSFDDGEENVVLFLDMVP